MSKQRLMICANAEKCKAKTPCDERTPHIENYSCASTCMIAGEFYGSKCVPYVEATYEQPKSTHNNTEQMKAEINLHVSGIMPHPLLAATDVQRPKQKRVKAYKEEYIERALKAEMRVHQLETELRKFAEMTIMRRIVWAAKGFCK